MFPTQLHGGRVEQKCAELRVVAGIWSRVVFFYVHLAMTNASDRPPIEPPEVNDKIGSDISHMPVDFLRLEYE